MSLKLRGLDLMRPALESRGGTALEEALWVFERPADAALAAVAAKRAVHAFNAAREEGDPGRIVVTGYGVHVGSLLFVEGTDVHWGDPVNTASKLGQDLAESGDILVSPAVAAALISPGDLAGGLDSLFSDAVAISVETECGVLRLLQQELVRSNVTFRCLSIRESGGDAEWDGADGRGEGEDWAGGDKMSATGLAAKKVAADTTNPVGWPGSDEAKAESIQDRAEKQMWQKLGARLATIEPEANEREVEAHMRDITSANERIKMARQRATLHVEKAAIHLQRVARGYMIRKKHDAVA